MLETLFHSGQPVATPENVLCATGTSAHRSLAYVTAVHMNKLSARRETSRKRSASPLSCSEAVRAPSREKTMPSDLTAMQTPPIVSAEAWEAASQQLLVREKAHNRARDALVAERRRMPWMAVEKDYVFVGPESDLSLLDLFQGRRQLVLYRAFFEPGVSRWP